VADIKVSNGDQIVKTDPSGRYEIPIGDDTIVFVIKPRGYMTPVNDDQLPQFYYIHKPAGSPPDFKYAGVAPTGPLPESVDFPLVKRAEPDKFRALIFGDTQPRDIAEVEYMAHDVIAQVIASEGHDAAFGVTLGDIVFDDLDVMKPHNQAIAMIGIPWYNVIGNHDTRRSSGFMARPTTRSITARPISWSLMTSPGSGQTGTSRGVTSAG
jgi:hypothetical protein